MSFFVELGTTRTAVLEVIDGNGGVDARTEPFPGMLMADLGRKIPPPGVLLPKRLSCPELPLKARILLDKWAVGRGVAVRFGTCISGLIRMDEPTDVKGTALDMVWAEDGGAWKEDAAVKQMPVNIAAPGNAVKFSNGLIPPFMKSVCWAAGRLFSTVEQITAVGYSTNLPLLEGLEIWPGRTPMFHHEGLASIRGFLSLAQHNPGAQGVPADWVMGGSPVPGLYLCLDLGGGSLDCSLVRWIGDKARPVEILWTKSFAFGLESKVTAYMNGTLWSPPGDKDIPGTIHGSLLFDAGFSEQLVSAAAEHARTLSGNEDLRVLISGKGWELVSRANCMDELWPDKGVSGIIKAWPRLFDTKMTTSIGLYELTKVPPPPNGSLRLAPDNNGLLTFVPVQQAAQPAVVRGCLNPAAEVKVPRGTSWEQALEAHFAAL